MANDERAEQLAEIADEIEHLDESPLYEYRKEHNYLPVPGEGDVQSRIVFIGEAPGEREAKTGRPFVGAAGKVLDELLASIGIRRKDVYITNVVKDRPPGNRDPQQAEIVCYAPFLWRQIQIIQPRVIATLGRFSMDYILEQFELDQAGQKISDLHGQPLEGEANYGKVVVVPLYHPAVALYNIEMKNTLREDFQVLRQFL